MSEDDITVAVVQRRCRVDVAMAYAKRHNLTIPINDLERVGALMEQGIYPDDKDHAGSRVQSAKGENADLRAQLRYLFYYRFALGTKMEDELREREPARCRQIYDLLKE